MFKKPLLIFFAILLTLALPQIEAGSLQLTLDVSKENRLGADIVVHGNLTLNGSPVTDGIVAIQIDDPHESLFVLRTLPTGESPAGPWSVEILELITVDSSGNLKSSFTPSEGLGVNITVKNNGLSEQHVIITLNLYYSDGVPFIVETLFETEMEAGLLEKRFIWPIPIPHDATCGPAFAYASALNRWPKNNGFAYCPEKSATFNIVCGGSGGAYTSEESYSTSTPGEFNLTFCTNRNGGIAGIYNVSAVSQYQMMGFVANHTTFEVILIGDVTGDGKVRVDDVLAVALAFGSDEDDPDWDPIYDLTGDGKVRVDDVLIVAKAFGSSSG